MSAKWDRFSDVTVHKNHITNAQKLEIPYSNNTFGPSQCVKSVHIRKFFSPYFPAFGLNTERYRVSICGQFECGKIRT